MNLTTLNTSQKITTPFNLDQLCFSDLENFNLNKNHKKNISDNNIDINKIFDYLNIKKKEKPNISQMQNEVKRFSSMDMKKNEKLNNENLITEPIDIHKKKFLNIKKTNFKSSSKTKKDSKKKMKILLTYTALNQKKGKSINVIYFKIHKIFEIYYRIKL